MVFPFDGGRTTEPNKPGNLRFTANENQWDRWVLYKAGIPGGNVYLTRRGFYYLTASQQDESLFHLHPGNGPVQVHANALQVNFANSNSNVSVTGIDVNEDYANYFIGKNQSKWAGQVPIYNNVLYQNFYNNIDMLVKSNGSQMKYDLIVKPGADEKQISINYNGAEKIEIKNGNLVITTNIGQVIEAKPFAYLKDVWNTSSPNSALDEVPCRFVLTGTTVTFDFPKGYDHSRTLVIDPTLIFSTYTGSTADNFGYTATYDAQGDLYLGGYVNAISFTTGLPTGVYPTTAGAFDITWNGGTGGQSGTGNGIGYSCDMGITKFNPNGTALIYSTYLGGADNETPHSLFVNNLGQLVVYGRTYSNDFPTTAGAYDATYNGLGDISVTVFNTTGSALVGSTYIGGTGDDGVNFSAGEFVFGNLKYNYADDARGEVISDLVNNIYVASCTKSTDFPVSNNAFQSSNAGQQDGCVFKLNNTLTNLIYSTYLGGSNDDACYSLDLNNGTVYTCGGTMSANFPSTSGTWSPAYHGGTFDGFVCHLNSSGSTLLASTFIGTAANDQTYMLKLDAGGNVYFTGQSNGGYAAFNAPWSVPSSGNYITKMDAALSNQIFTTTFGNGNTQPNLVPTAFLVDTCENLYVCGWGGALVSGVPNATNMLNMPLTANAYQSTTDGKDFYLIVIEKNAQSLLYATYFGGNGSVGEHVDGGTSRFDKNGIVYEAICASCGGGTTTPTTTGVWSPTNQSQNCNELGFKMEINLFQVHAQALANPAATGCMPLTVNFVNNSVNSTLYYWNFGTGVPGDTSNLFQPTFTFTDTGTYSIMLIASNPTACIPADTAYTTVIVYDSIVNASFNTVVTDFCDSVLVQFIGISSGSATQFSWDYGDGTNGTGSFTSHTYFTSGSYTIVLYAFDSTACNHFDTITQTITIGTKVDAGIDPGNFSGCAPLTVQFADSGIGGITYSWNFGDGSAISNQNNPVHTYNTPGVYTVTLIVCDPSSCNGCDTAVSTITVLNAPPLAAFTANPPTVQITSPIHFTNQSVGANQYTWLFGDGDTSTLVNPSHIYLHSGDYTCCLVAQNNGGCPDTACRLISIKLIPVIDVPNAFSPNNDGMNDILYAYGQDVTTMVFRVYNRWGQKVFETTDINTGWDGTFKGVMQEMEVYAWTLSANFTNGESITKQGNVTLLK